MGGDPLKQDGFDQSSMRPARRELAVPVRTLSGQRAVRSRREASEQGTKRGLRSRPVIALFAVSFAGAFGLSLAARALLPGLGRENSPPSVDAPARETLPDRATESPIERPSAVELVSARPKPAAAEAVPPEILLHLPVTRDLLDRPTEIRAPRSTRPGRAPDVASNPPDDGLYDLVATPPGRAKIPAPLRVEYTLDPELTRDVHDVLATRHVPLAHVIVMDPADGRVLAYASTDVGRFPPNELYPAASLIKVVTAAAALHHAREKAEAPCHFLGSPYALPPARIDPPRQGQVVTLERALATSNNQCFAQLAVHALGSNAMIDAIRRFGLTRAPAPGHPAGRIEPGDDRYDLGKLGCGLAGCFITPLHAAQLAGSLARGQVVEPYWVERVLDANGRELALPRRAPPRQVMTPQLADELRGMLIETTQSGTARRGFRGPRGASRLGPVQVAGKTGSLNGVDPAGRYEWFAGVAPADDPKLAIAVVVVQQQRVWMHASQVAGEVLERVFCAKRTCRAETNFRAARQKAESDERAMPLPEIPELPAVFAAPVRPPLLATR